MRPTKFSILGIAALAILAFTASDLAFARGGASGGGGGGGGGGNRGGGGRAPTPKGTPQPKTIGGAKSAKDKNKKDLEAARERLRQADWRGRDSAGDRGAA